MTLEDIYFVAGILTGFGVIISLVFVGIQIREQVRESRVNANFLASNETRSVMKQFAEQPALLELFLKATDGEAALGPVESARLANLFGSQLRLFEALYYQNRDGRLDDWMWSSLQRTFQMFTSHPAFANHWRMTNSFATDDFREFVDRLPKVAKDDYVSRMTQA